jgi:hypothetical protein
VQRHRISTQLGANAAQRAPGARRASNNGIVSALELPSIGWQLFILDSSQSDSTAFPSCLDTYATRLLTEALIAAECATKLFSATLNIHLSFTLGPHHMGFRLCRQAKYAYQRHMGGLELTSSPEARYHFPRSPVLGERVAGALPSRPGILSGILGCDFPRSPVRCEDGRPG